MFKSGKNPLEKPKTDGKLIRYTWDDISSDEEETPYTEEGMTFQQLLEQQDKLTGIQENNIVTGTVIQFVRDYAMVDIGYKSEGQVPIHEFLDHDGNVTVDVGDKVDVYLEKIENEHGLMVLSKDKADMLKAWERISTASENDELVEGTIVSKVKGGLSVDIGIKAFLPGSQVDVRPTRNLDQFLGNRYKFKIIKFNKKRGNVVLSRKILLEKEREDLKSKTLENIQEGIIVKGVVKNITDYGAFIDLGGVDGLLHITDMSWGRIKHPSEVLKVGDDIELKVLKYDASKERVSLGLKQLHPDPWESVQTNYPVSEKVSGRVVSLAEYGAFVELEPGVEGLVHVSEMSWIQKIKHPSKILSPNQMIEAVVLDVDQNSRRISLGIKQIEPNPWDTLEENYPIGSAIKGKIKNITDFGIFVGVEEGIDGLVHISDISWDPKLTHPSQLYKKGEEIEAVVLSIDKNNERFALGIKQLEKDPWETVEEQFPMFSVHEGTITKVTDFGLFIELTKGIEGLLHISELSDGKIEKLSSAYTAGDSVRFAIISVDTRERKIGLSLKALQKIEDKENLQQYEIKAREKKSAQLGDILNSQMKEKLDHLQGKKEESASDEDNAVSPATNEEVNETSDPTDSNPAEEKTTSETAAKEKSDTTKN